MWPEVARGGPLRDPDTAVHASERERLRSTHKELTQNHRHAEPVKSPHPGQGYDCRLQRKNPAVRGREAASQEAAPVWGGGIGLPPRVPLDCPPPVFTR